MCHNRAQNVENAVFVADSWRIETTGPYNIASGRKRGNIGAGMSEVELSGTIDCIALARVSQSSGMVFGVVPKSFHSVRFVEV
jgi:hypothetical protein